MLVVIGLDATADAVRMHDAKANKDNNDTRTAVEDFIALKRWYVNLAKK